ncbi:hypothetical protein BY458DRAFT_544002 [Sporodiniella umbellata]|nr:hypothetical protein BY458DRAFT_544002 [Sporodiniella umbellata]
MAKRQVKLQDLYKKKTQKKTNLPDKELALAIKLSKEEHAKEQKRLFELFEKQTTVDDEDDWFQTISHHSSSIKQRKNMLIKKDPEEERPDLLIENLSQCLKTEQDSPEPLLIDNLTTFLKKEPKDDPCAVVVENLSYFLDKESLPTQDFFLKKEKEQNQESGLTIDNLSSFLEIGSEHSTLPKSVEKKQKSLEEPAKKRHRRTREKKKGKTKAAMPNPEDNNGDGFNDKQQFEQNIKCPVCESWFADECSAQKHLDNCSYPHDTQDSINVDIPDVEDLIKDPDESDCSIIDLCDPNTESGYLSPLEGFSSVFDIPGENPFLAQFKPKAGTKKKETNKRSEKPKGVRKRKFNWKRKAWKKNN